MDTIDYNEIDDYLLKRLGAEALGDFEKKLKADPALAAAVAAQQKSIALLNSMGALEQKMEVQDVAQRFKANRQPSSKIRKLRPWLAAASILLLLGISYWLLQGPSSDQLYQNYYVAYDTGFGTRDAADAETKTLSEASRLYKQKEYEQALATFAPLPLSDNAKAQLMIGISQLEVGDFTKALQSFDQLIAMKDPVFQYHAIWYAAMTHLKVGDIDLCQSKLQQLISAKNPNGVFQQAAAKELFDKL